MCNFPIGQTLTRGTVITAKENPNATCGAVDLRDLQACPAQAGGSRGKGGGLSPLFVFHINVICVCISGFPGGPVVKNPPASVGYSGSIPGSGRPPGAGSGNPLQDSCLENPMDRGAWRATVHGVAKSQV